MTSLLLHSMNLLVRNISKVQANVIRGNDYLLYILQRIRRESTAITI